MAGPNTSQPGYAGSTYGPVGPRTRAPRLGGPAPGRCFWIKERKKKLGEKKREKKEKGGKEGEKEKGKVKKLFLGQTNWHKDSHVGQRRDYEGPWGPPHPWMGPGPRRCLIRPRVLPNFRFRFFTTIVVVGPARTRLWWVMTSSFVQLWSNFAAKPTLYSSPALSMTVLNIYSLLNNLTPWRKTPSSSM